MSFKDLIFVKRETVEETLEIQEDSTSEKSEEQFDLNGEEQKKGKKINKKRLFVSLLCVFLAITYFAGYIFYVASVIPNRFDTNYESIMKLYGKSSPDYLLGAEEELGALYAVNNDLAGVVEIKGSGLYYPFVKPKNRSASFYDEHLFNLTRCEGGTPYTNSAYSVSGFTNVTVIFGQSYKSRMFSCLSEYMNLDYYLSHPTVRVHALFGERVYKIFAVSPINATGDIDLEKARINTQAELDEYCKKANDKSNFVTDIDVSLNDRLLVMVTDYQYGSKIAVFARELRQGELANLEQDFVAYKSSNMLPDDSQNQQEVINPEQEELKEETDIVTEEGDIPQNEQNAGAILPDVEDDTPIITEKPQQPNISSSAPSSSTTSSASSALTSSGLVSSSVSSETSSVSSTVVMMPEEYVVTTKDTYLNVRDGAGVTCNIVGRVEKGETVTVLKITDGWAQITASGGVAGYVDASYLTKKSEMNSSSSTSTSSNATSSAPGTENVKDKSPEGYTYFNPTAANEIITVKSSLGNTYTETAYSIICRIVEMEVGSGYPIETIKAQAVASYSYIMYRVRRGSVPTGVAMKAYEAVGTRVKQCVASVIGKTLVYNNKICDSYYATCTAGRTNDVRDVWSSGTEIPYLTPVDSSIDKKYAGFTYKKEMTSADVIKRVKDKLGIDLSNEKNKANWFKELDKNRSGVYNGKMSIAGHSTYVNSSGKTKDITGQKLYSVFSLRSAAFDVTYNASADTFTFTTYGWGHGVGMSQVGAYYYAKDNGWNYLQILLHYYPGAVLRDYA